MTMYSITIDYRDTSIDCTYDYEPSGIGGDYDEILPASVEIESLKIVTAREFFDQVISSRK